MGRSQILDGPLWHMVHIDGNVKMAKVFVCRIIVELTLY